MSALEDGYRAKLDNLAKALLKLKTFADRKEASELERAGVIQAFEFTFEQFWKLFARVAQSEGVLAGSPKAAIRFAFQRGFINHDELWLKMLEDRNLTSHTYNEALAERIYQAVRDAYVDELESVEKRLRLELTS